MRKIGDDAKEDSQANPTIMATIATSATRAKLKVSYGKKERESPYLAVSMGEGVVDYGKAKKKGQLTRKRM